MAETEQQKRRRIIELCLTMNDSGLNQGTSGNISARHDDVMLITPSGIPYRSLKPEHIAKVVLKQNANHLGNTTPDITWHGPFPPSSEWHFHLAILLKHSQCEAIVHTHSTFATTLSISRKPIPACHYMVGAFGGNNIRCADYATFGTQALADNVLDALQHRLGCLMANHGMVTTGKSLDHAMWLAVELETLARQYYYASAQGDMVVLPDDEMDIIIEKFKNYGPKRDSTSELD